MLMEKSCSLPGPLHLHFNGFWELGDKAKVTQRALGRRCGQGREGRGAESGEREGGSPAPLTAPPPPGAAQSPAEAAKQEGKSSQEIKPTLGIKNKCQPVPQTRSSFVLKPELLLVNYVPASGH